MYGFKSQISGVGSDHSTNWATATIELIVYSSFSLQGNSISLVHLYVCQPLSAFLLQTHLMCKVAKKINVNIKAHTDSVTRLGDFWKFLLRQGKNYCTSDWPLIHLINFSCFALKIRVWAVLASSGLPATPNIERKVFLNFWGCVELIS